MRAFLVLALLALLAPAALAGGQQLRLAGPGSATVGDTLTFTGTFTSASGAPLKNRDVAITVDGASPSALTVRTDAQGVFAFDVSFTQWMPVTLRASVGKVQSNTLQVSVSCGAQVCAA